MYPRYLIQNGRMGRGQARNNVLQDLEHVFIASGPVNVIIQITSAYVMEPDIVVHYTCSRPT